jgi:hypothetical protein
VAFELDLTDVDSLEKLEAGGRAPVGWYNAELTDFYEDTKSQYSGQSVFEYTIRGGPFNNEKVFDRVTDPRALEEPSRQRTALNRIKCLGSRLGLVGEKDLNKSGVSVEFADAVGRVVVIQIKERKVTDEKTQEVKTYTGIAFDGVYPPDHYEIPADVRQRLGLPPARPKESTAGRAASANEPAAGEVVGVAKSGGKPVDDFSDL